MSKIKHAPTDEVHILKAEWQDNSMWARYNHKA